LRALDSFVQQQKIPHAIMFNGQQGCGKFTLAVIFAKNVLSFGLDRQKADRIAHLIDEKIHPDVSIVTGNDRGLISVDTIRGIGSHLQSAPNEGDRKIIIIKDCDQMNEQAQNALLKMLEEPPAHVLFLLTCNRQGKLLPTIKSRVVGFDIVPPTADESALYLQKSGYDAALSRKAAGIFDGNIEKMIEYCKGENTENFDMAVSALAGLSAKKPADLLAALQGTKNRLQLEDVCDKMRLVITVCAKHPDLLPEVNLRRLHTQKILAVLDRAEQTLSLNGNLNLTVTWLGSALFGTLH